MQLSKEEVAYLRDLVRRDEHGPERKDVDKAELYDKLHYTWWTALRQAAKDIKHGIRYDNPDHNHLQEQINLLSDTLKALERAVRRL